MRNSKCWYYDVCDNECSGCIRYMEMSYLLSSSNIPVNRQRPTTLYAPKCDYASFKRLTEIKNSIAHFVNNGNNLYITSKYTGNGKTSWSIKLLLKYFDVCWAGNGFKTRGLFVHIPTFLLRCKDFNNYDKDFEVFKKNLQTVDLVVWDDIASTDISAYDYSQLLMYLDIRTSNSLSNIYTGNIVDRTSLQKALGSKLTSRIMSSNTEIIEFEGGDSR